MLTSRTIGVAALLVTLPIAPATPARADPTCVPPTPVPAAGATPWAQTRFDLPRLSEIADGHGITVAVVDSGVDAAHPQLAGAVLRGEDLLSPGGTAQRDCVGHGTAVASIIAAAPATGVDFAGLAPKVRILPFRVTEREIVNGQAQGQQGSSAALAAAIRDAADQAQVVNLSLTEEADDPLVRSAVAYAVSRDVVVVAAAGNGHRSDGADAPSYPAAYPGVLGVGAIDEAGQRVPQSQVGSYVRVVAPGANVTAAAPGHGVTTVSGTSFAAPFVSATAALIRQYYPGIRADQVEARILATADPAPGARPDGAYGYGVLDPYRAVTDQVPAGIAAPSPPAPAPVAVDAGGAAPRSPHRATALLLAGGGTLLAGLILLAARVLPRGAARRWRPDRG